MPLTLSYCNKETGYPKPTIHEQDGKLVKLETPAGIVEARADDPITGRIEKLFGILGIRAGRSLTLVVPDYTVPIVDTLTRGDGTLKRSHTIGNILIEANSFKN